MGSTNIVPHIKN